jgi:hypothetical protein
MHGHTSERRPKRARHDHNHTCWPSRASSLRLTPTQRRMPSTARTSVALVAFLLLAIVAQVSHAKYVGADGQIPPGTDPNWVGDLSSSPLTVNLDDKVVFQWAGFHSVYILPSLDAWNNCDFSAGTVLDAGSQNGKVTYDTSSNAVGYMYFACGIYGHCQSGLKLAVHLLHANGTDAPTPKPSFAACSTLTTKALCVARADCVAAKKKKKSKKAKVFACVPKPAVG